eukprot:Hpha_TRINITY_DN34067_c0_g1::TRINITY_DN34067_c0_g1_i1::g.30403::m.30403
MPKRHRRGNKRADSLGPLAEELSVQKVLSLVPDALRTILFRDVVVTPGDDPLDINPGVVPFKGSALFIDVSGFSTIASKLQKCSSDGAEQLTHHLNIYFTKLLDIVRALGGDVALFSGDAILAQWGGSDASVRALQCGGTIIRDAQGYSFEIADIYSQRPISCEMRVHIGAASGGMAHMVVGGSREVGEWRYVLTGEPVEEAGIASGVASDGQMAVSEAMVADVASSGIKIEIRELEKQPTPREGSGTRFVLVESADLDSHVLISPRALSGHEHEETLKIKAAHFLFNTALHAMIQGISGEIRTVYTVFLKLCQVGYAEQTEHADLHLKIDAATKIVQRSLVKHDGVLNKVVMDDKGVLMLVLFGVPHHMHEDDAARAALFAVRVERKLRGEVGRVAVGISRSKVFCGLTGSEWRCEYTVVGDGVNIAARLMGLSDKAKHIFGDQGEVTCDGDTAAAAELSNDVTFTRGDDVYLKGQSEPFATFRVTAPDGQQGDLTAQPGRMNGGPRVRAGHRERLSLTSSLSSKSSCRSLGSASTASLFRFGPRGGLFSPSIQDLPVLGMGAMSPVSNRSRHSLSSVGARSASPTGQAGSISLSDRARSPRPGVRNQLSQPTPGSPAFDSPRGGIGLPLNQSEPYLSPMRAANRVRDAHRRLSGDRLSDGFKPPEPMRENTEPSNERVATTSSVGGQSSGSGRPPPRMGSMPIVLGGEGLSGLLVGRSAEVQVIQYLLGSLPARSKRHQGPQSPQPLRSQKKSQQGTSSTLNTELNSEADYSRRVALVIGDIQMGKTSLLGRAQEIVVQRGSSALWLVGQEATCGEQYVSIRQLLLSILAQTHIHLIESTVPEEARDELKMLHYVARISDLDLPDTDYPVDPKERLAVINRAMLRVIRQHCGWPMVILVDDEQWIDDASMSFVSYATTEGARVVMTRRNNEVDTGLLERRASRASLLGRKESHVSRNSLTGLGLGISGERSATLVTDGDDSMESDEEVLYDPILMVAAEGQRRAFLRECLNGCSTVHLQPLDLESTGFLIRSLLQADGVDPAFLRIVRTKAGGAPGFIVQMVSALAVAGLIEVGASGRACPVLGANIADALVHAVPAVEALIMRNVDALSVSARRTVGIASVVASATDINSTVLQHCLAKEGIEAGGAEEVRELVNQGFLTQAPLSPHGTNLLPGVISAGGFNSFDSAPTASEDMLRFTRPLARDVIYGTLLASDRRRLHGLVADIMIEAGINDDEVIAQHLSKYGEDARAVPYITSAYNTYIARGAVPDAFSLLQMLIAGTAARDAAVELRVRWQLDSILCLYELGHLFPARNDAAELVGVLAEMESTPGEHDSSSSESPAASPGAPNRALDNLADLQAPVHAPPERKRKRRHRKQPIVYLLQLCCCFGAEPANTRRRSKVGQSRASLTGDRSSMYTKTTEIENMGVSSQGTSFWRLELCALVAELALWLGSSEDMEEAADLVREAGTNVGTSTDAIVAGAGLVLQRPCMEELTRTWSIGVRSGLTRRSPFHVLCDFARPDHCRQVMSKSAPARQQTTGLSPMATPDSRKAGPGGHATGGLHVMRPVTQSTEMVFGAAMAVCAGKGDVAYDLCQRLADSPDPRFAVYGHMLRAYVMTGYAKEVVRNDVVKRWLRPDEDERIMQSATIPAADGDASIRRFALCFRAAHQLRRGSKDHSPEAAVRAALDELEATSLLIPCDVLPLADLAIAVLRQRAAAPLQVVGHNERERGALQTDASMEMRVARCERVVAVLAKLASSFPFAKVALLFVRGCMEEVRGNEPEAAEFWTDACAEGFAQGMPCSWHAWRGAARLSMNEKASGSTIARLLEEFSGKIPLTPAGQNLDSTEASQAKEMRTVLRQLSSTHSFNAPEVQMLEAADAFLLDEG